LLVFGWSLAAPSFKRASNRARNERRYTWNDRRLSVPSRSRCHQWSIRPISSSRTVPTAADAPPRSMIACTSRSMCAQQNWRIRSGHHPYAPCRSETSTPDTRTSRVSAASALRRA